ncbi:hypothetical protein GCM10010207_86070 [Streptomyces atratus]|nr:hypothetical protein GCM10010207_86070 [Streptomyces atratus]
MGPAPAFALRFSPQMKPTVITPDCADPEAPAVFYRQATGLELHPKSDGDFAGLTGEDGLFGGFQRVDDYQASTAGGAGQVRRPPITVGSERSQTVTRATSSSTSVGVPSRADVQDAADSCRPLWQRSPAAETAGDP